MAKYETMLITSAALDEEASSALIGKFKSLIEANGTIDSIDEWGKRRLAYAINYKTEGYYVLMYIKAPADLPRELERNLKISDQVLRYLVIRYEGELPAKREMNKPAREAVETPAAPVEAPAAPVEAPAAPAEAPAETADEEAPVSEAE